MSEELDIPATLAKLGTPGVIPLSPVERVLAGHTGTVVLLLSLYFNKPVKVLVVEQEEIPAGSRPIGSDTSEYNAVGVIHRSVALVAGDWIVAKASTVIPLAENRFDVLEEIRRRDLGLGHIAVKLGFPTQRTIICIEATDEELSRTYVMQGREHLMSGPGLYYTITETFPRALYGALGPQLLQERWHSVRQAAGEAGSR